MNDIRQCFFLRAVGNYYYPEHGPSQNGYYCTTHTGHPLSIEPGPAGKSKSNILID
jgi:hypothetical protein